MAISTTLRHLLAAAAGLASLAFPGLAAAAGSDAWHLSGIRDVDHREAEKVCHRLEEGGRSDWRLPTPGEIDRLAARAREGGEEALALLEGVGPDAAWTRDVSATGLAWAAAFAHGFQLRIHASNERALRVLCVAGEEEGGGPATADLEKGPWQRALDVETDSPLLWGCSGDALGPRPVNGSIASFRDALPPGPLRETVPVDYVIDVEGRARWIGPAPGTSERLGRLAVSTLGTFRWEPATCDGEPMPIFFHIDFGQPSR